MSQRFSILLACAALGLFAAGCGQSIEEKAADVCASHGGVANIEPDNDITCKDGFEEEGESKSKKKKSSSSSKKSSSKSK